MGDIMRPIPFEELLTRIFDEYQQQRSIFGIPEQQFYSPKIVLLREFFGISSTISLPAVIAYRPSACCAKRLAFRVRRCAPVSRGSSRVERSRADADRVRMCVLPSR